MLSKRGFLVFVVAMSAVITATADSGGCKNYKMVDLGGEKVRMCVTDGVPSNDPPQQKRDNTPQKVAPPSTPQAQAAPVQNQQGLQPHEMSSAQLRDVLPKLLENAIDNPSQQNAYYYWRAQQLMQEKARRFSVVSKIAFLKYPQLREGYGASNASRESEVKVGKELQKDYIKQLVEAGYKIGYAYSLECHFCQEASVPIEMFGNDTGFKFVMVNIGSKPGGFPGHEKLAAEYYEGQNAIKIAKDWGVFATPTFVLLDSQSRPVTTINLGGQGYGSAEDMEAGIINSLFESGQLNFQSWLTTQGLQNLTPVERDIVDHDGYTEHVAPENFSSDAYKTAVDFFGHAPDVK